MVMDLEIREPSEFIRLELFDPQTGISVPVVIAEPAEPPKEEPSQGNPDTPDKPKPPVKTRPRGRRESEGPESMAAYYRQQGWRSCDRKPPTKRGCWGGQLPR